MISERVEALYGFTPKIIFKSKGVTNSQELKIENKKILNSNFVLNVNLMPEIDNILIKCHEWF